MDELESEEIKTERYNIDKTRLILRNKKDNENFKEVLKEIFFPKHQKKLKEEQKDKKVSNVLRSRKWFMEKLEDLIMEEGYTISDILATTINKLNFVEIELTEESDIIDVFISLNNTGLNLSEQDLVKSLIIKQIEKRKIKKAEEIEKEWNEKIVSAVSSNSKSALITSREMKRFLQIFWRVEFNGKGKITNNKEVSLKPTNIVQLFSYKLDKESDQTKTIFENLVNYADIYGKLKNLDEEYWKDTWSEKMCSLIKDMRVLKFKQLDPIIVSLDINWRQKKKPKEIVKEKDSLVNALEKIVLYMFRAQTIKKISPGDLPHYIPDWLQWIKQGTFVEKIEKDSIISKEFEEGSEDFYEKLKNYWTEDNSIHKYIFRKYYFSKDKEVDEIEKKLHDDVSVEHMLAKNPRDKKPMKDEVLFSIGNTTLLRGPKNKNLGNLPWIEKKEKLVKMEKKCMLYLEDNNPLQTWPDKPTATNVQNRAGLLIDEFKSLEIFEIKKK